MCNGTFSQHAEDKIHGDKKKINNNNNNNNNAKMLNIYDQEHERVKEFKYPGKSRLEENVITTANNYD
jgi:hypothetical protein